MKTEWISTSCKLPEESIGLVLVCFPDIKPYNLKQPYIGCETNQRIQMATYSQFSGRWHSTDGGNYSVSPIAWMPLPEPCEDVRKP